MVRVLRHNDQLHAEEGAFIPGLVSILQSGIGIKTVIPSCLYIHQVLKRRREKERQNGRRDRENRKQKKEKREGE